MAENKITIEANCQPNPASITTLKNDTVKFHNKSGSTCTITFPGTTPFGQDKTIVIDQGNEKVKTVTLDTTEPVSCNFTTSCGAARAETLDGGDGIIIVDPPPVDDDDDDGSDNDQRGNRGEYRN